MRRKLLHVLVAVGVLTFFGRGVAAQDANAVESTPKDRKSVAVTIYNNGIGLVRETREVRLPKRGRVQLDFQGVAPTIRAPSVALSTENAPRAVKVVEQSYRYDVLSPTSLTRRAAGLPVSVHRIEPGSGKMVRVPGTALANFKGMTPVLRTAEGITYYPNVRRAGVRFSAGALGERADALLATRRATARDTYPRGLVPCCSDEVVCGLRLRARP